MQKNHFIKNSDEFQKTQNAQSSGLAMNLTGITQKHPKEGKIDRNNQTWYYKDNAKSYNSKKIPTLDSLIEKNPKLESYIKLLESQGKEKLEKALKQKQGKPDKGCAIF